MTPTLSSTKPARSSLLDEKRWGSGFYRNRIRTDGNRQLFREVYPREHPRLRRYLLGATGSVSAGVAGEDVVEIHDQQGLVWIGGERDSLADADPGGMSHGRGDGDAAAFGDAAAALTGVARLRRVDTSGWPDAALGRKVW